MEAILESVFFEKIWQALTEVNKEEVKRLKENLISSKADDGCVYFLGNGGSSSIASHVATDLTKTCKIRSSTFNEANLITCYANDFGHDNWMAEAIKSYANSKDKFVLISSSGQSKNIINAAKVALEINPEGVHCFTGFSEENPVHKLCRGVWVNSKNYNIVELAHLALLLNVVEELQTHPPNQ
jgi:D-sedoheptulose 7-phosphate isomerase